MSKIKFDKRSLIYFCIILIIIFITHCILIDGGTGSHHGASIINIVFNSFLMTIIVFPFLLVFLWSDIKKRTRIEEELRKSIAEKDKFFAIIAHDLRSPFQGFIGLAELLAANANEFTKAELTTVSKEMHQKASNLFVLLENLLEWAHVQRGTINFSPQDCSLSEIINHSIEIVAQNADHKNIEIINSAQDSSLVYADEKMIDSVLRNLLSNAVKFTPKGGKVVVSSRLLNNTTVEISVADSGIGMSDSLRNKLFIVGEKVGREGTDGEKSSGLGLLLCKEFIEKNGGNIRVESQKHKGSTFRFTLPLSVNKK
ncbi:MAG: HAMP domain-containing histidine kinase [Melioribacteraceae bacterium]|nr:HAMP domain-containing histidine kinase [Melioribacteraceae bacterium]